MHCPSRRGNANTFKGFVETSCQSPQFPQHKQLQNFWPRSRTSESSNCWERNTVTCGSGKPSLCECSCEQGLAWFLDMGGPTWCEWEQPPSSSSPARAAQAGPGECHTWDTPTEPSGAATGIYPKKHAESHLFHHHLKEREGNLCKVLKGAGRAGQWWWLHRHGPSPSPTARQESWGSLLRGEQRGCQTNSGNSSHENQGKAAGKRLLHQTDVSISSPGSTGSCHRNKIREREMCRWDLSPAILLLFPADWDCKSHPCDSSMRRIGTRFWQLQAWQTEARAGPTGAALPKRWLGKRQKEKELKCWCFMVCIQRSPSAGHGERSPRSSARWRELSTLLFPLPRFPGWAQGTPGISSLPGLRF